MTILSFVHGICRCYLPVSSVYIRVLLEVMAGSYYNRALIVHSLIIVAYFGKKICYIFMHIALKTTQPICYKTRNGH